MALESIPKALSMPTRPNWQPNVGPKNLQVPKPDFLSLPHWPAPGPEPCPPFPRGPKPSFSFTVGQEALPGIHLGSQLSVCPWGPTMAISGARSCLPSVAVLPYGCPLPQSPESACGQQSWPGSRRRGECS